jgi:hypothetical protein
MTAVGEEASITEVWRGTPQVRLYSATCTGRRETIQLLFLVEQAELRIVVLLSEKKKDVIEPRVVSLPPPFRSYWHARWMG